MNKTGEIIPFEELVRRELDSDQIVDLIRRTPGIKPVEREMARLRLVDDLYDADIAVADGINYSRSSVTRHLAKVIPIIEYRYLRDKAGA
jgi:hypothetical protein